MVGGNHYNYCLSGTPHDMNNAINYFALRCLPPFFPKAGVDKIVQKPGPFNIHRSTPSDD